MINAAVFHRLLISVLSHYGKGDEAVGDPCRDGAAHLWNNQSGWELIYDSCQRGCLRGGECGQLPWHTGGSVAVPSAWQEPLS